MKVMLSDKLGSRQNNFNFLRFMAATAVVFYHSHMLAVWSGVPIGQTKMSRIGGIAVSVFIIISGFLVTKSWLDAPAAASFLKKRFLRIFPALACSVLMSVVIIGPLVTYAGTREYFTDPLTIDYLKNVFLFPIHYNLPGVFERNLYPGRVNDSLWTLPVEVLLYFCVLALGLMGVLKKRLVTGLAAVVLLALDILFGHSLEASQKIILTIPGAGLLQLSVFFFAGAFLYLISPKVPLAPWLGFLSFLVFSASFFIPEGRYLWYISLPYLVLFLAYRDVPVLKKFGGGGDPSYGIYVYSFPIQQGVVYLFKNRISFPMLFLVSYIIILAVSYLSWHMVEKQVLKLKKAGLPGYDKIIPLFRKSAAQE